MTTPVPRTIGGVLAALSVAALVATGGGGGIAIAAEAPVGLGTAASFSVLAGSTVTNTGASTLSGDLGLHPGTDITGFPPGIVGGTVHATDAAALQAQNDTVTAYDDAAGRSDTATVTVLGGQTLVGGVYAGSSLDLSGTLTLDAQGDPNTVFIFKSGSELTTASGSTVSLVNGAQACNVFWQVTSSATLGSGSEFVGTLIALTSITAVTAATVNGRLLARNGAVTLDTNTITSPAPCVGGASTTTTAPDGGTATTAPGGGTATTSPSDGVSTTAPGVPDLGTLPPTGSPGAGSAAVAGLLLAIGSSLLLVARRSGRHERGHPTGMAS